VPHLMSAALGGARWPRPRGPGAARGPRISILRPEPSRQDLLMQAQGFLQVSPAGRSDRAFHVGGVCLGFAGVAQLVEHLFCKQAVRGSSPLASSSSIAARGLPGSGVTPVSEGCPSGQREQAVNLPASAFVGSNPTPSTRCPAGVAQLVERQPSKLNVAGSNPVSRSAMLSSVRKAPSHGRPLHSFLKDSRRLAHIAQLAERVLGKDEVTSSTLVVGSKPTRHPSTPRENA
jgi:hypothetical protein